MDKMMKTVFAVIGALAAIAAFLLLLKKLGCKCKGKCCCKEKEEELPETVEDFVEEAAEKVEEAKEKVEEAVEEVAEQVEDKAAAVAEEFKDYADVELPAQE